MKTIGIRAAPTVVTFAVFDATDQSIVTVGEIKIPKAFTTPDALKYVRSNLLDILREYQIAQAGIRATEPMADRPNIQRVYIEGVIQEAFASSELNSYYIGYSSSISARIGVKRTEFNTIVSGDSAFGVDGWDEFSKTEREAILCAIGAAKHA
jgi:hypothetical protein